MKKYLLAIDGSKPSSNAVDYCREIFEPGGVTILAVNVVPAIPDEVKDEVWNFEMSTGDKNVFEVETEMLDQSESLVENATTSLSEAGFEIKIETRTGHPGSEICQLADTEQVDGIIIGRSGKGVMSEVVLGSVSHYVVHHAAQPVIIVPEAKTE